MASYANDVSALHKKYQTALKKAKTRQGVMNLYWKHKKDHEKLLKKHLKEEMAEVVRVKSKIEYR